MTTHKLADTENMASRCKANKLVRMIRFIDPEYNTLFSIPDGSSIVMIWMNGNRSCVNAATLTTSMRRSTAQ